MKTYYYKDELNDEFSEAQITPKRIDASYNYEGYFQFNTEEMI